MLKIPPASNRSKEISRRGRAGVCWWSQGVPEHGWDGRDSERSGAGSRLGKAQRRSWARSHLPSRETSPRRTLQHGRPMDARVRRRLGTTNSIEDPVL